MGIIIHSLESVSFKDLYAAFSSAFKDYDFSLNADELRRMLDRRVLCLTEQACTTTS